MSASEQNYANGRQTATISVGNEGVKDASGFSVDVYEDDDWIDTVDVNESIASGEEKEIEIIETGHIGISANIQVCDQSR